MDNSLRVTELDFDQIKQNLKIFLQSQPEFNSYDFEGSALSQLLNVLSYTTHYNAVLANSALNESFQDSAIKRGSVVSRTKEQGYLPRSAKSALAIIDISIPFPDVITDSLTLDRFTLFSTTVGGTTFNFYNKEAVTVQLNNNRYDFSSIPLYEGVVVKNSFNYQKSNQVFEIPNIDIDTDSLGVYVKKSSSDTFLERYTYCDDITNVNGNSKIYFLQQNSSGKYEIYFGDGTIGKIPSSGNIIVCTYLVSSKTLANVSSNKVSQSFRVNGAIGGNTSSIIVTTSQNSSGGADQEDVDSIKFNAPLALSRAKRIVTADDYLGAINEKVGGIESVSVWGGEENVPPIYGKVFISLKPYAGYVVTDAIKSDIKTRVLQKQGNILITPVFVEPEYLYLGLSTKVSFDAQETTSTSGELSALIEANIRNYFALYLNKFKNKFYFSVLSKLIDNSNDSIRGNVTQITLQKRFTISPVTKTTIDSSFTIKVRPQTLSSNSFYFSSQDIIGSLCSLMDDGNGNIGIIDMQSSRVIRSNIGSIDYTNGNIFIKDFMIDGLVNNYEDIRLTVSPDQTISDVEVRHNQIITLDDSIKSVVTNTNSGLTVTTTT